MKRVAILLMLCGYITVLYGQGNNILDSVVSNITKQLAVFPQEKIYLQTDKPYYINGEQIFFRAFLLDAFSNKQDTLSRYVYVELINPADSVVQRVKIRCDSTFLFYGAIPLQEDLPQGTYKIRAYTQYMQNQGESSFFSKYVRISDPQILEVQTQSDFQLSKDGKINANLRFVDAKTKTTIHPQSIALQLNNNEPFMRKSNEDGWVRFQLDLPAETSKRVLYVVLRENGHIYEQYIRIPYPEGDFDVSFYPEGGQLIAGQPSNVAFKALTADGATLNITGEITDSKGNMVAEFETFHDGMGEFFISPLPGEHYQAVCHNGDRTLRFDLPEAQSDAVALKAIIRNNKLQITVNKSESTPFSDLYLIIHSRGSVVYAKAWDTAKNYVSFDTSIFPSGINHILLMTKDLQIVSERLVFLLNNDQGIASFQTQEDDYQKREQVQAEIQLKDEEQQPLKGNFSIAVTNDKEVIPDTTSSILSDILLSSELRGHIENPEYYFQKRNKEAEKAADLLMKTQGWTRYAIPAVIQGKLSYPKIPFEQSQEISGTVKSGLRSSLAKNLNVSLLSLNYGFFDFTKTDKNGHYVFRNFEFPDSTNYVVQVLNKKGKGRLMTELYFDEDSFPKIHTAWVDSVIQEEKNNPIIMDYVAKADQQYTYEHGMRTVNLPEVRITGNHIEKYKNPLSDNPFFDYYFSDKDIERLHIHSVVGLLSHIQGAMTEMPLVMVDGNVVFGIPIFSLGHFVGWSDIPSAEEESSEVINILMWQKIYSSIGDVENIKQVFASDDGFISIYTKGNEGRPLLSLGSVTPLGYQLPIEFYSPKYDAWESVDNSNPDLRTTIYWKPNVLTDDEGNAKLDFYTADDPGTYSVIIEGISEDGRLIHYRGESLITVK